MTKRVLVLSDDEVEMLVSWGEVAKSVSDATYAEQGIVAHDWEDEDTELATKLREARLK